MTLQQKLDGVRTVLEGTTVNADNFFSKLAEFYGYDSPDKLTLGDLEVATWEDLEDCGLPKGKARQVAKIFRPSSDEDNKQQQPIKIDISNDPEKHAATLTPVQLVEYYNPDNHTNPYGIKLREVTESRPCLAFNKDGTFNPEVSKQLVQEIVDGYPERNEVVIGGLPLPTFKVGDRPDRYANENPANPGIPLRPDGESDCGCNWGALATNVRQLVWLAVKETGEAAEMDEQDIFDRVEGKNFEQVAKRFRQAAVVYHERETLGTLPQLKIRLGRQRGNGGKENPFGGGHKVY